MLKKNKHVRIENLLKKSRTSSVLLGVVIQITIDYLLGLKKKWLARIYAKEFSLWNACGIAEKWYGIIIKTMFEAYTYHLKIVYFTLTQMILKNHES